MVEKKEIYTKFINSYETRFSDFDKRGSLKGDACLSFFESARFDITRKTGFLEKLMRLLDVEQVILPVVEVKQKIKKKVNITERVKIVTYIKDVSVSMFTFHHVLVNELTGEECMSADLKVVVVIPGQKTLRSFDILAMRMINETIHSKGDVTELITYDKEREYEGFL